MKSKDGGTNDGAYIWVGGAIHTKLIKQFKIK